MLVCVMTRKPTPSSVGLQEGVTQLHAPGVHNSTEPPQPALQQECLYQRSARAGCAEANVAHAVR
eukprot:357859-Chlamydomonas_euryale.AAC.7